MANRSTEGFDGAIRRNAERMIEEGRQIFRFDTFGDEAFWGGTLKLHQAIAGRRLGGVGPGVSPRTALAVGLKVDAEALPPNVLRRSGTGAVDLNDPAVTLALLDANAVVGVTGDRDPARTAAVGRNPMLALSFDGRRFVCAGYRPAARRLAESRSERRRHRRAGAGSQRRRRPAADRSAHGAHGAQQLGAGQVRRAAVPRRQGVPARRQAAATLLPAAFGLAGVNLTPIPAGAASRTGMRSSPISRCTAGHVRRFAAGRSAAVSGRGARRVRQRAERPGPRSRPSCPRCSSTSCRFRRRRRRTAASTRAPPEPGKAVFNGAAGCATCHVPPLFTEPGWNMHTAEEIGIDDFQASRSPDERYRTTPLAGLLHATEGRLLP